MTSQAMVRSGDTILGTTSYEEAITADMARMAGIPAAVLKHPALVAHVGVLRQGVSQYLRLFGFNVTRQRRKLDIVISDWQYLQSEVGQRSLAIVWSL